MTRIAILWITGSIAALLLGGIVGARLVPAETYDGRAFGFIFGGIGTLAAFVCFRLWR